MKSIKSVCLIVLLLSTISCGFYSFNGASIDYNLTKTLSVANIINESGGGPPNMGNTFTEGLRDYFQRRTQFELVPKQGDVRFEGAITNYNVRPQAISSSGSSTQADGTGLMRLLISVQVFYTNTKDEEKNIEQTFSFFADYDPSSTTLNAVEDDLVQEIFEQLYFDIFQASFAQW